MPLDLGHLQTNTKALRIDYGEAGDVNVTYRPANLTETSIRQLRAIQASATTIDTMEEKLAALNTLLRQLVVSWDLTRDGVPIPLTEEALSEVPMDVRGDIVTAIVGDTRLGERTGTPTRRTSRGSSARKARTSSGKRG